MNVLKTTDRVQLVFDGDKITLAELYALINECKRRNMSLSSEIEFGIATPNNMAKVSTITVTDEIGRNAYE